MRTHANLNLHANGLKKGPIRTVVKEPVTIKQLKVTALLQTANGGKTEHGLLRSVVTSVIIQKEQKHQVNA